jgi:hypothetical protein
MMDRKRKDVRFTICCSKEFHELIKEIARNNHRTVSSTVVLLVEQALNEREYKGIL